MYEYAAVVREVYDADTVTVDIDLGLGVWMHGQKIRVNRINAPEMRGTERPEGIVARDYVRGQLLPGVNITIQTIKDTKGKYGRWLGEIYFTHTETKEMTNLSDDLVAKGYAHFQAY